MPVCGSVVEEILLKKKIIEIVMSVLLMMSAAACGRTEEEPYGLTVFLKTEPSSSKIEDELRTNADELFDLIGNLGTLEYKVSDSSEVIASYER